MQSSIQKKIGIAFVVCLVELLAFVSLFSFAEHQYAQYELELKDELTGLDKIKKLQHALLEVVMPINDLVRTEKPRR